MLHLVLCQVSVKQQVLRPVEGAPDGWVLALLNDEATGAEIQALRRQVVCSHVHIQVASACAISWSSALEQAMWPCSSPG